MDLIFIGIGATFFAFAVGLVVFSDGLKGGAS